jgi:predicted RND superfamily exporter protein
MKLARWAALLVTIASMIVMTRLSLSRDLTDLFPDTPEASMLARVTRLFGGGDVALVLLRGDDPAAVDTAVRESAEALRKTTVTKTVITGPPSPKGVEKADPTAAWRWAGPVARAKLAHALTDEGMRERLHDTRALLLAPGAGDAEEWLTRDPLRLSLVPWEERVELAAGARAAPGASFVANEGRTRLIVVQPLGQVFEGNAAARFTTEAEAALDAVRKAHPGVRIDLTGGHVIARQTERLMKTDLQRSGVLSMVLASLFFVVLFRRPRALVAVLPPLVAGTLWTTAIAALLYPRLSAVATAFAAVVIGVGVDTGVHVYGKLLAARREGLSPSAAADKARAETWRPTLGAAVAAGAAFACLALADIEGMRQLGVLCAAGEVLTAVAILLFVPEAGAWLERGAPPPPAALPGVASLTATRPRAVFALAASIGAVGLAVVMGVPKLDHAVVALDARTLPAMETYDAIYAAFGGTRGQLVVVSADVDESKARARADAVAETAEQLEKRGTIAGFDSLAQVAPSLAAQRARLAMRDKLDLPSRRAALLKALGDEGFATDAFTPALDVLSHPSTEVSEPPPSPMVDWFVRRHLAQDARGWIAVTFVRLTGDHAQDLEARAALRAADPEAVQTGFAELERSLKETLARDMPRVLLAAIGMVVVVLAFSLRRLRAVVLALAVLTVEISLVLLAARALHVHWHVYDALVLPVLLGITLDEALFLLEAAAGDRSIEDAIAEQAPLAATTALTTAAGFGALIVCRFGGLVDIGKVGALGSTVGLVCAFVVIPAGYRLFARPSLRERDRTH